MDTNRIGSNGSSLPDALRGALGNLFQRRYYGPGIKIVQQGDQTQGLYIVRSGRVKLLHETPAGRVVVLQLATATSVIGLNEVISDSRFGLTVETIEHTEVDYVARQPFIRLLHDNPRFAVGLLDGLSREVERLRSAFYKVTGRAPLTERLLRKLQLLARTPVPEGMLLNVPLTVQDLADSLGCSRQWASRLLGEAERQGLIKRRGREIIVTPAGLA